MDFQHVKNEGIELQSHLPWLEMVAVGGTSAAMHAVHRFSTDIDNVTPLLKQDFNVVAEQLDKWEGWKTNRFNRPVIILGERHQVELGLRQQLRTIPIESEMKEGLLIPTLDEALRIKAYLLATRKATRDYLDVAALSDKLGQERTVSALRPLNFIYPKAGSLSALSQFSSSAQESPADFEDVDLSDYKGIISPYNKWSHVASVCSKVGTAMFEAEMTDPLLSLEGRSFRTVTENHMNPNRSTSSPSPLSIANIVCRGGTADWQELYRALSKDPEMRVVASRILLTADTEAAQGAIKLFRNALDDMNCELEGRGASTPIISTGRSLVR